MVILGRCYILHNCTFSMVNLTIHIHLNLQWLKENSILSKMSQIWALIPRVASHYYEVFNTKIPLFKDLSTGHFM